MISLDEAGHTLMAIGLMVMLVGGVLVLAGRLPALSLLGRLPGDIVLRWGNGLVFVPLATSLLISVVLTVLLNLIAGFRR